MSSRPDPARSPRKDDDDASQFPPIDAGHARVIAGVARILPGVTTRKALCMCGLVVNGKRGRYRAPSREPVAPHEGFRNFGKSAISAVLPRFSRSEGYALPASVADHDRVWTRQCEASKVIATNPTPPFGVEALSSRQCAAQGGSVMLNKTWAFALALALAAAPVSSLLAAVGGCRGGRCRRCRFRGCRSGCRDPQRRECDGRNGCCKCHTPAAKMDPAGAKPSSPSGGDPAATNNK